MWARKKGEDTSTGVFSCFPRLKKTIFRDGITLSEIQTGRSRPRDFFFVISLLAVVCLVNRRWKRTRWWVPTESEKPKARTTCRESLGHWSRLTVDAKSSTTGLLTPLSGIQGSKYPEIPVTDLFCVHITQSVCNPLRLWPHTEC